MALVIEIDKERYATRRTYAAKVGRPSALMLGSSKPLVHRRHLCRKLASHKLFHAFKIELWGKVAPISNLQEPARYQLLLTGFLLCGKTRTSGQTAAIKTLSFAFTPRVAADGQCCQLSRHRALMAHLLIDVERVIRGIYPRYPNRFSVLSIHYADEKGRNRTAHVDLPPSLSSHELQ